MLTQYVRSREAEVARTMAGDTEHLAAHHLHSLRRLSLVSHASQRHHDLTEKEELAAFHTTITHVTTQLEEELAAARVERESVLEDSWAKLAQSMRDHEAHTASLRANCHHLQDRVSTNQKNLVKVNQGISDMQQEVEQLRKRLKQQDEESDAAQELQHLKSILQVLRVSLTTHRLRSRTLIKAINQRGYSAKKQLEEVAKEGKAVLELASACRRLETPRDRNIPFMPTAPQPSAASVPDDTLTTRLLSVTSEPASEVQVRPVAKDLETQVAMNSDADEGLGTSVNSSRRSGSTIRAPLRKVSSVMEADEGVASVNGSSSTTATPLTLPKIPVVAPGKGGSAGGRGSGRGSGRQRLGRDKLARINELLNHEEAAQEAAHTHGPDRSSSLDPPPDFVLQEADTVLKTHDDLRNFWRKYHHVQLERLALRSEAEALRQEGQQLRARLRYYLVSLGMTDAALTQTAAPVTVSHVTLSLYRKDDTPAKRRSKSVPAGIVGGRMMTRAAASKGPLIVQEGGLLVKAAAMHSTQRIFT
ncbi:uncharacterized protein LOC125036603 [Penaeus chinensis]|uniref:uncharacterized protein LOC125036603 n=1 Tax=Penaeus chinensis TaxID=139456 RepID=UPI001FB811D7|nr:uncharacterized protein LOC125036603 [Penaeus chinensis]